jgi:hypothetical protein
LTVAKGDVWLVRKLLLPVLCEPDTE